MNPYSVGSSVQSGAERRSSSAVMNLISALDSDHGFGVVALEYPMATSKQTAVKIVAEIRMCRKLVIRMSSTFLIACFIIFLFGRGREHDARPCCRALFLLCSILFFLNPIALYALFPRVIRVQIACVVVHVVSFCPPGRLPALLTVRLLISGFVQVRGFKVSVRRSKQPRTACALIVTVGDVCFF